MKELVPRIRKIVKRYRWFLLIIAVLGIAFYFALPDKIFNDPYSTVLEDKNGNLLSASIAADGQWRFPLVHQVPDKFSQALIHAEDKRFYSHLGVDVLALARAVRQNSKAGKVISGGSTLSMQVIRLSRKNKPRTVFQKIIEIILATRLEFRYSKNEILALYATHAPFGGNVIGLEAACWRFFGRNPSEISWSEAALLAVLPNNPSLIHLGKNRARLKFKRDKLLDQLASAGKMDATTLQLAKDEPIPESPIALPREAPHLLARVIKEGNSQQKIRTTIDFNLQQRVSQIINQHHQRLKANQVFNAAAIILEVKTGNVLAYVGNTASGKENNEDVDVVSAPRSTGSILKPFLYAAMLNEGKMLPGTLWQDVPTFINGYSPKNFSKEFEGAVPANAALIRSLNVPAVHELRIYRYEKFYDLLKNVGLTTLSQPADHYGLTLVLGGAEGSLWDITGAFASMARTLNNYFERPGKDRYSKKDFHAARYVINPEQQELPREESSWLTAASIYTTFDVLKEVYRPGEGSGWKYFSSAKKIAWKTGTSFGFRDGWAVGVNPDYAVGVWVGNADGEGRPGLTGTEAAAPILFDVFSLLPGNSWFGLPLSEMEKIAVCQNSGHRATVLCESPDTVLVPRMGLVTPPCPYHKKIFLTSDRKFRVHSGCEAIARMREESWFVLPPIQEFYFKQKNISYKPLPPLRSDCSNASAMVSMDLIYPKPSAKVFVPYELDGTKGNALFEATHRNPKATLFWHIDGQFFAATTRSHKLPIRLDDGVHTLLIVDDVGESLTREFTIISSRNSSTK
ncbi:MAG: penicillin-binding protein 1C [Bacteroidetes bacterium]|nr:penicillin-binding protein 1C [Bacteroidota bacterium]